MRQGAPTGNQNASKEKTKVSIDTFVLPQISLEQAADLLNVGRATVARVKAVEREAPELVEKIERGEMTEGRPKTGPIGLVSPTARISLEQFGGLFERNQRVN